MRSGICNCFALYDWNGNISPVRFHDIAKKMFDDNAISPDIGSVSDREDDLQMYSDLVSTIQASNNGVSLYHTIPGYSQLVFGWDAFASLDTRRDKTMIFCFAENLAQLGLAYFESITTELATEIELTYGIGYQRDFELGPDMYAYGMVSGLRYNAKDISESDRISVWMHERPDVNRHLKGYLRDVYPLNIISSPHMLKGVGEMSLGQWITKSANRGQLTQLSKEAWLWKVPKGQLSDVRDTIQKAGCTLVPAAGWHTQNDA